MPEPITSVAGAKILVTPSLMAGLAGATLSLKFVSHLSWYERLTAVFGGAIMAQYFAPLAAYTFNIEQFEQAVSFFIGLFGLSLTAAIYETIKKADIWGLILSRYGKRGSGGDDAAA